MNEKQKSFLEKAKQHAKSKGGECLSNKYVVSKVPLVWKCHIEEHDSWENVYNEIVNRGKWCPQCSGKFPKSYFLEKAKQHAKSKGGECLSNQYVGTHENLMWKCHIEEHDYWPAEYNRVVNGGSWCPQCSGNFPRSYFLEKAKQHAELKGGKLLSEKYERAGDKLVWKCSLDEHDSWLADYNSVVNTGTWCPQCSEFHYKEHLIRNMLNYLLDADFKKSRPKWNLNPKTNKPLELDGYAKELKIAFEFQGEHHYKDGVFHKNSVSLEYTKYKDSIKKQNCLKNNIKLLIVDGRKDFKTHEKTLDLILRLLKKNKVKVTKNIDIDIIKKIFYKGNQHQDSFLEKAKEHAKSKGGMCLSEKYIDYRVKLIWKCSVDEHDSWPAVYDSVVNNNKWCPQCGSLPEEFFLEKFKKAKEHAKSKGGDCLSTEYINAKTPLVWKCSVKDHEPWLAIFNNVVKENGTWCSVCTKKEEKNAYLEIANNYAFKKGGKCLSTEYIDAFSKLTWLCNKHNYSWESSFEHTVRRERWKCICCKKNK